MRLLEAGEGFGADLREVGLDELAGSNAIVALRVGGETEAAPILAAREHIGRLIVAFSGFKDGRGFSLAAILREGGFEGELIATGDLIPDHAPMLARCGFDAAELPVGASVADWRKALGSFSVAYQPAADHAATVWARRGAPFPLDGGRAGLGVYPPRRGEERGRARASKSPPRPPRPRSGAGLARPSSTRAPLQKEGHGIQELKLHGRARQAHR